MRVEFRVLARMSKHLPESLREIFECWSCGYNHCKHCERYYDNTWDKLAVLLSAGA